MRMKNVTTIDYLDSPYSKVILDKEFRLNVFKKLIEKYKLPLTTPLAKKIGIEPRALKSFLAGDRIIVDVLERLRKQAEISIEETRNSIDVIDSMKEPSLPLNFNNNEGIRLIAGIVNEGRVRSRTIEYHNKNEEILKIIRKCARKVIGNLFQPSSSIDKRMGVKCLYFPPFVAKYFIKIGLDKPKIYPFNLPKFITDGDEDYARIWLRAFLGEDASLYPYIQNAKNGYWFLYPRIQLNRNIIIPVNIKEKLNKMITPTRPFYKINLPLKIVRILEKFYHPLLLDESKLLKKFGINLKPKFSKVYMNKDKIITATHSLSIIQLEDLEIWLNEIGCELSWQRKQLELLLSNRGSLNRVHLNDVIYKFYSLIPSYLRDKRKINESNTLTKEQKNELLKVCGV